MDSAFAHARQLVIAGQTAAGRAIADSILTATSPSSPAYGSALFGRAQLAPTAADAQRDYQRIIVEYPLSTHAGDALLQLAQMERSQGNRGAAITHLQRFLGENPTDSKRARAGFWLAQLLFEQNNDTAACGVLRTARSAVAAENIELQNQMSFYSTRCDAAIAQAVADSTTRADSVRADSVRADSTARADAARKAASLERSRSRASTKNTPKTPKPDVSTSSGEYSVQVGAYGSADQAQQAVVRLQARGVEARVDGDQKPFRVRVGHYATRAEAAEALTKLKTSGIDGFVANTGGH